MMAAMGGTEAVTLDLSREGRAAGLVVDESAYLADADREAAIGTWKGRMVNEHVSARVFAALLPQLMRAGISAARQAQVAEMIADELRHARMCAAVVTALGGEPVAPLPPLDDVPTHDDASPLEAVLRNVLSISCLSETVAVALIDEERLVTTGAAADTAKRILADEVQHARFGWTLLEELQPRIDDELRARLGRYLQVAFAHLEAHELSHLPPKPAPSTEAEAVGVCDGRSARELFYACVTDVIVPGLEKQGLPAARAWRERTATPGASLTRGRSR